MTEEEQAYHSSCEPIKGSVESQMFGKPCYKLNSKAFVCFFQEAMVFKLTGEAHSEALGLDGSQLFDPSGKGRPMKEWVQVTFSNKGLWNRFTRDAAEYISSK